MSALRELNRRENAGIIVTLAWNEDTGEIIVVAEDRKAGTTERCVVEPHQALDAFYHPYVYTATRNETEQQARRLEWVWGGS